MSRTMVESGEFVELAGEPEGLFQRRFQAADHSPPRFGMLMVHGWGDHLGCLHRAAQMFVELGGLALGVDWPGNGKSHGIRGHLSGVDAGVEILNQQLDVLRNQLEAKAGESAAGPLPIGLFAHSTGCLIGLKFLSQLEPGTLKLCWLSSPLVRPEAGQAAWKRRAAGWIARVFPRLSLDTGVRSEQCRRPHPETGEIETVPGGHSRVSAGFGDELATCSERGEVMAWARRLSDPLRLLMTLGGDDTVCRPEYGRELFETLSLRDKTRFDWPGFRHEPHLDPYWPEVSGEVKEWLKQALARV